MLVCRLLLVSSSPSVKRRRFTDIILSVTDKLIQARYVSFQINAGGQDVPLRSKPLLPFGIGQRPPLVIVQAHELLRSKGVAPSVRLGGLSRRPETVRIGGFGVNRCRCQKQCYAWWRRIRCQSVSARPIGNCATSFLWLLPIG